MAIITYSKSMLSLLLSLSVLSCEFSLIDVINKSTIWVFVIKVLVLLHTSITIVFQIPITLLHILNAFWLVRLSKALMIAVCPSGFEKSTPSFETCLMRILLIIPNTNSTGARWGQYWGSPNSSIFKHLHSYFDRLVRWIDPLSTTAVITFNFISSHLFM